MKKLIPRSYQEEAKNFMINHNRCINASECGLGKTIETIMAIAHHKPHTVLIFCPKIAREVWRDEFKKWYGWESDIYEGTPDERHQFMLDWKTKIDDTQPNIIITNFYFVKELHNYGRDIFDAIVVDEFHLSGLNGHQNVFTKNLKKYRSTYLYLLSGTPLRKGIQDIYGPLSAIDRIKFSSYWRFCGTHSIVWDNRFGKEVSGVPRNPEKWKKLIGNYVIRHLKNDHLDELPDKIRTIIKVRETPYQLKVQQALIDNMFYMDDEADDFLVAPTDLANLTKLKQLLDTPYNLGLDSPGGALEAVVDKLNEVFIMGDSAIVATPYKSGFDKIEEYIMKKTDCKKVFRIHGGMKRAAKEVADDFNNYPDHRKILLLTIASGVAFTATGANHTLFLGADYQLINNIQTEDRTYRIGQKKVVHIYYFLYPHNEVHRRLIEILDDNKRGADYTIDTARTLEKIKKKYKLGL